MKKRIIATNYDPAGALCIVPVIKALKKDDSLEVVAIGCGYSKNIFTSNKIKFRDDSSYGAGLSIKELAKNILTSERPDLILMGTSRILSLEKELTILAKKQKIPTLAILDYWSNYWQRFSNIEGDERLIYLPDKIAVMDTIAKNDMIEEGFPEEAIIVTGNPHFEDIIDSAKDYTEVKIREIKGSLSIQKDSTIITFISETQAEDFGSAPGESGTLGSYLGYTETDSLKGLVNAMCKLSLKNKNKIYYLIVKLHPREIGSPYSPKNLPENLNFLVIKDFAPRDLIAISDVVVGMVSGLLFEACLMGKPVVVFQPGLIGDDLSILNRLKLSYPIFSQEMLEKLFLKESILPKNDNIHLLKKGATEKVVNEIYKLLEDSK